MLINWLFLLFVPYWKDLILSPDTGRASLKRLAAAVGFIAGIAGAAASIWADVKEHRPVEKSAILLLLANGLGLQALAMWGQQQNRQTADENGNPLAQPGTADPPAEPKLMPQQPTE